MGISDTIIVLHLGQKLAEGKPADIQGNDRVLQAYLGRSVHP
jgi:ABC-type branched-subunit amino acid transport system ATPase component